VLQQPPLWLPSGALGGIQTLLRSNVPDVSPSFQEQFANLPQSALVRDVLPDDSSFEVVDASGFSSTGFYRIIIDGEIIGVGARSGNWMSTLRRGHETTNRQLHLAGATVTQILTAGGLIQGITDRVPAAGAGTGWVLLETHSVSSPAASMTFVTRNAPGKSGNTFQDDFASYVMVFVTISPQTDGGNLYIRYSINGGASYDASAVYFGEWWAVNNGGGAGASANNSITGVLLNASGDAVDNSDIGTSGTCYFLNPRSTTLSKQNMVDAVSRANSTAIVRGMGHGYYSQAAPVTNFQMFYDNGNINYGSARLYGLS